MHIHARHSIKAHRRMQTQPPGACSLPNTPRVGLGQAAGGWSTLNSTEAQAATLPAIVCWTC
jgi:hypothetical protein